MPGISLRRTDGRVPPITYVTIGFNQQIRQGDIVVLSDHSNESSANVPAARLLHPADITDYMNAGDTVVLGVYGVALHGVSVDANGASTGVPDPVTLAGVRARDPLSSMADVVPQTTAGRSRLLVAYFADDALFGGQLKETTTVTDSLIGTRVGIAITPKSGTAVRPLTYQWSTAATVKIGVIAAVNYTDPKYNVSGGGAEVLVRVDTMYQQFLISADWYDQSRSFAS